MPFLHGTLRIVRARAPRRWSIAPHRASTRSEGVEHCSTSCEHVLRGRGTLLHVVRALLRGRGALLHVVRARAPRVWNIAPRRASTAPRAWNIAPRRASTAPRAWSIAPRRASTVTTWPLDGTSRRAHSYL